MRQWKAAFDAEMEQKKAAALSTSAPEPSTTTSPVLQELEKVNAAKAPTESSA